MAADYGQARPLATGSRLAGNAGGGPRARAVTPPTTQCTPHLMFLQDRPFYSRSACPSVARAVEKPYTKHNNIHSRSRNLLNVGAIGTLAFILLCAL